MVKSKQKRLGFGIVGLGGIAAFHAKAAQSVRGAQLVACFSRDASKAQAFAETYKCRAYSNYTEFLRDQNVDIVAIASASGAHKNAAVKAAKAKKHVIVEKPLEVNPARCKTMIQACKTNRVKLATIFPTRFKDLTPVMKAALTQKRLGKVVNASAYIKWFRPQAYYSSSNWKGTWALDGGGALMNQGIHSVDFLIYLMGDPIEVMAYYNTPSKKGVEVETNLVAILKFKSGALGTVEASTEIYPGYKKKIEISGTHGSMAMVEDNLVRWEFAKGTPQDARTLKRFSKESNHGGGASDPFSMSCEGHQRQFQELVDVINKKKSKLTCDGQEGLRSVRIVCAIYKSAETGKPVKIK